MGFDPSSARKAGLVQEIPPFGAADWNRRGSGCRRWIEPWKVLPCPERKRVRIAGGAGSAMLVNTGTMNIHAPLTVAAGESNEKAETERPSIEVDSSQTGMTFTRIVNRINC
jgi:hypothetical protein